MVLRFLSLQIPIPVANTVVQNATEHVNGTYTGLLSSTLISNLYSNYSQDYSSGGAMTDFASVFGVLFSGVTGIMAGANMSGNYLNNLIIPISFMLQNLIFHCDLQAN